MMNIIAVVSEAQIETVAELAKIIWVEHYTKIIGSEAVDYSIKQFQSVSAISNDISTGTDYFLIFNDNTPVGYFATKTEDDSVFLSKLYILKETRGQGISKQVMEFVKESAKKNQIDKISLMCNIDNKDTLAVYEKAGFEIVKSVEKDIGAGYIMHDLILELSI